MLSRLLTVDLCDMLSTELSHHNSKRNNVSRVISCFICWYHMYIVQYPIIWHDNQFAVIHKQLGSACLLHICTMYMSWSGKQKLILRDNIIIVTTGHTYHAGKNQVFTGIPRMLSSYTLTMTYCMAQKFKR